MSLTFTLKGYSSSSLSADLYPPIELDSEYEYSIALIGFHTYNSIPNIEEGRNNKFVYYSSESADADGTINEFVEESNDDNNIIRHHSNIHNNQILDESFDYQQNKQSKNNSKFAYDVVKSDQKKRNEISIPEGSYEIGDIEQYIQSKIGSNQKTIFTLKPNNNTLKCEIKCIYDIDFEAEHSVGPLLGFSPRKLPSNVLHESDLPVEIVKVKTIRLECNIVHGSFYCDRPSHTLYEFSPMVDPGYAIDIEPHNRTFLPVNTSKISHINVSIVDQDSEPVNFRGEEIIVRLELKRVRKNADY